ncbi:KLHL2 [Branchiostoma lanceolatum]|uniref:KLHL2 protein n=1 Tax=Branchiostoma lanceolatum TaxID=7740 RepID=A0A8K0A8S2_BRALA|nr:KLHL2 [Branchiostoma lanceolatum]
MWCYIKPCPVSREDKMDPLIAEHSVAVLDKLRQHRQNGLFTDITLTVGKTVFPAHRNVLSASCPYFEALFSSQMSESRSDNIPITFTSPQAMEAILDYLYIGRIEVAPDNVEEVLMAADQLLLTSLKNICSEFLQENLTIKDCLYIKVLADLYGLEELFQRASKFIQDYFDAVICNDDMMLASFETILELISDDKARVLKEESVFETIVRWTEYDLSNRKEYFPKLMGQVRLVQLDEKYLLDTVQNHPLVKDCKDCREYLLELMRSYVMSEIDPKTEVSGSVRLKPRQGRLTKVVVTVGGESEEGSMKTVNGFVIDENRWVALPDLPMPVFGHAIALLDGCAYVVGGTCARSVYKYDPLNNSWTPVADMNIPRLLLSVVVCDRQLYAIGGCISSEMFLDSVEMYDPQEDDWQLIASMQTPRCLTQCVAKDERHIYTVSGWRGGTNISNAIERYDLRDDTWSLLPPYEEPFPIIPHIMLLGNSIHMTFLGQKVLHFNTEDNTWKLSKEVVPAIPREPARRYPAACMDSGDLFVCGGRTRDKLLDTGFLYVGAVKEWYAIAKMGKPTTGAVCAVTPIPYEFVKVSDKPRPTEKASQTDAAAEGTGEGREEEEREGGGGHEDCGAVEGVPEQ